MPAKNSIKQYLENGFYHIYNRGVDKRTIFENEFDYKMFLSYLKNYLIKPYPQQVRPVRPQCFYETIQLISYCLMPNHFHLLLRQKTIDAITHFMRSFTNAYTRYFNTRHKRIGPLFQGCFKGVLIQKEPYFLHLTRYIHVNPRELLKNRSHLYEYPYSSYADYLGIRRTSWVHPEEILAFFKTAQDTKFLNVLSYQSFVEEYEVDSKEVLDQLILEDE